MVRLLTHICVTWPQWVNSRRAPHTSPVQSRVSIWFWIKIFCVIKGLPCIKNIVLASHPCTCVLHRQVTQLHTLKLPKFFHFHGDFHQNWYFAHPKISFAHPELPFLAKSMMKNIMLLNQPLTWGGGNHGPPGTAGMGSDSLSGRWRSTRGRWRTTAMKWIYGSPWWVVRERVGSHCSGCARLDERRQRRCRWRPSTRGASCGCACKTGAGGAFWKYKEI